MLVMIDLDNTLVDRAGAVRAWAHEFVAEHRLADGGVARIVELDADGYSDRRQVFTALRSSFDLTPSVDELLDAYRARVVELTEPAEGATACLASMRARGWSVVIVTNGSSGQQHDKIDSTGLRDLVDAVVVSGDHGIEKPDRRIYELAAERVSGHVAGAWMVGDSPENDIVGPARLGVRTVWIDRGRDWVHDGVVPDLVVGTLDGLAERLSSLER